MTLSIAVPSTAAPTEPAATTAGATVGRPGRTVPVPVLLVAVYIMAMPFLAGLTRGTIVPLLRPSEVLQLTVTGGAVVLWLTALAAGRRRRLHLEPLEWWLLGIAITASVVPALWLMVRGLPLGGEELLATFPFVKYTMLYFLVRACVGSTNDLEFLSRVIVGTAMALTAVAIGQALGLGPILDVIGRFYADGAETVVDEGRGTTTLGSSIATGALLSFSTGLALSWGLATGRKRWLLGALVLTVGTVASGQVGSLIALGVVVLTVSVLHGRIAQLARWGLPAAGLVTVALWPVVAARLASIDQGTGLPSSWIIRWNNVSELYLPSLLDRGWILGVSPDAILAPPDVWRDTVYLESGYLLLLWVGGVPLLVAAIGFMITAWRALGQTPDLGQDQAELDSRRQGGFDHGVHPAVDRTGSHPVSVAAKAAIAMMLLLSLIDPHLSLRGGADLFYILIALGLAGSPMTSPSAATAPTIRAMLSASDPRSDRYPAIRIHLTEVPAGEHHPTGTILQLMSRLDGADGSALTIQIDEHRGRLTGTANLIADNRSDDPARQESAAVLWRAAMLVADSLRLDQLAISGRHAGRPGSALVLESGRLRAAAALARSLERDREAGQHRVRRADGSGPDQAGPDQAGPPALRLGPATEHPRWKRSIDVVAGSVALVAAIPLLALCAVAVRRSGDGPVLYRQLRIGAGGLPFRILKFRTMYVDNDDSAHRAQNRREILENADAGKDDADPRITPVGRFLRRTSLDELPQLVNVLRSEMSLVGPRPSLLWETELFDVTARRRLRSRPGITGLWQVNGRADLSMSEMLALDVEYVDQMSPGLDLRCLARTATSVVAGEGAR